MEERKARLAALAAKAGRVLKQTEESFDSNNTATIPENETQLLDDRRPLNESQVTPSPLEGTKLFTTTTTTTTSTRFPLSEDSSRKRIKLLDDAVEAAQTALNQEQHDAALGSSGIPLPKVNADLKRDIEPLLKKLERRTQKALVSLLKERLEQEARCDSLD
jgi:cwf18 pre-mRNA splicing factor